MTSKYFNTEQKLSDQLSRLKGEFSLYAIKAEFEAEGASFRDLIGLRRLTTEQGVSLYLKISGVESLRDLKDALDLGVDGLIAPMVESTFGVVKFIGAVESIFGQHKIYKSINIETGEAVKNIDAIIEAARGKIDNITIGRTDLSHSYFDSQVKPDSPFIFDLIESLSYKIRSSGLTMTVGGSITSASIDLFNKNQKRLDGRISSIETRKVVLSVDKMLGNKNALTEALRFEEYYLLSKLEREKWLSRTDQERLAKLKTRL